MAGIFISYRHSDSGGHTGRLTADLVEGFEPQELFRDLEAIEAGVDFVQAIERAVGSCSVMLAVIGPQWVTAQTQDGKRRLDLENDFVRIEVETALARDLRVIPILVGDAAMPSADDLPTSLKPLARRQAHEITDRRWDYDVDQLFATLAKIPGVSRRKPKADARAVSAPAATPPPPAKRGMSLGTKVLIGGVGLVVVLIGLGSLTSEPPEEPALALPPGPSASTHPAVQPVPAVAPATPTPTATARAQPDALSAHDAPPAAVRPAAPPINITGPISITGTWQSDEGDQLYFEQTGHEVAVLAADGSGTQGFMGQGSVRGQRVELTLMHLQSGGSLVMQMTLSPDGRRMTGVARENVSGSTQNVTLVRE